MSESAPERSRGGFSFSQKIGPLPAYAWILLAAGGGVAYIWYRNRKAATASSAPATGTDTSAGSGGIDYAPELSTIQSEIQSLQSGEGQESGTIGEIIPTQPVKDEKEPAVPKPEPKPPPRKRPPPREPAPKPPPRRPVNPVAGGGSNGRVPAPKPAPKPPARRPPPRRVGPGRRISGQ